MTAMFSSSMCEVSLSRLHDSKVEPTGHQHLSPWLSYCRSPWNWLSTPAQALFTHEVCVLFQRAARLLTRGGWEKLEGVLRQLEMPVASDDL